MTTQSRLGRWQNYAALTMHIAGKELDLQSRYRNKFLSDVFSHVLGIAPIILITLALSGSQAGSGVTELTRSQLAFVVLGYTAFMAFGFGTPIMLYTGMAWAMTQEVQTGTIERNFLAPVPRTIVTLGHGAYYAALYAFHSLSLLALAVVFLGGDVSVSAESLAIAGLTVIGLIALSLGLGLASAGLYLLVRDGSFFLLVVHRPVMILSGAIFLIDLLPAPLRALALVNPVTYGIDAFRGAIGGRETLLPVWDEVAIVYVSAVVAFVAGAWLFRRIVARQMRTGELSAY